VRDEYPKWHDEKHGKAEEQHGGQGDENDYAKEAQARQDEIEGGEYVADFHPAATKLLQGDCVRSEEQNTRNDEKADARE
jgi:hypothetical protein